MEAAQVPWRPLGELFVSRGLITETELETALAEQAATGKRLGEILVDRGLVSSPELTAALMDQLGVEISKEEGFGSGLWAEIKRRHRRSRRDGEECEEDGEEEGAAYTAFSLVPAPEEIEEHVEPEAWQAPEEPELEPEPIEPEPIAVDHALEQELEEIRSDYTAPAEREPEPEPEPETEPELPPAAEAEPAFELVVDPGPEPESESVPELFASSDEAEALRAELAQARTDLARLQEMLADSMTALAALTAEAEGEPYAGE